MVIKRLNLVNFRNHSKVNLELGPSMNIFIGENASGKTNILESIVVLALTKSYKNINENNLIRLAKKKTKIKGIVKNDKSLKNLEIEIMETEKVVKVNNKRIYCLADYISNLNIVLFTPDDLELIKGSPSIRRNLLNMEISQLSSLYLNTYNQYNKIFIEIVNNLSQNYNITKENKIFIANFYKYGFAGIIENWIVTEMKESPENIIKKLDVMISGSFEEAVKKMSN